MRPIKVNRVWIYHQTSGKLHHGEQLVTIGYSGQPPIGKNNAQLQDKQDIGPIPVGFYTIGPAFDHEMLGPCTMRLTPDVGNTMWARDGFAIHGDSLKRPGWASHGCLIFGPSVRGMIEQSEDRRLQVVA